MKREVIIFLVLSFVFGSGLFSQEDRLLPEDLGKLAKLRLEKLKEEFDDIKKKVEDLERKMDAHIKEVSKCKPVDDNKVKDFADQIAALEGRFNALKSALTEEKSNIKKMMDELKKVLDNIKKILRNSEEWLEDVKLEKKQMEKEKAWLDKKIRERESTRSMPGFKEEYANLTKRASELAKELKELEMLVSERQNRISTLKKQKEALSVALNMYNQLLCGVQGLWVDIVKLKLKLALLRKLKPKKEEENAKQDNGEKNKLKIEIKKEIKKLTDVKKYLEKIKKYLMSLLKEMLKGKEGVGDEIKKVEGLIKELESLLDKKEKEKDPKKMEDVEKKINEVEERIKKLADTLPDLPRRGREPGKNWNISIMGIYASPRMTTVNGYIEWINSTYQGNIPDFNSSIGGSATIAYQVTNTIGVGVAYEHLRTTAEGTLVISPPPTTIHHSHTISTNGFLAVVSLSVPPFIKNFDFKGIVGAGVYLSKYNEIENGFSVSGSGSCFGYKVGIGMNYSSTGNFGLCLEAAYRGISVNRFKDSSGNKLQFVPGYGGGDVQADFSGFGISLGISTGL